MEKQERIDELKQTRENNLQMGGPERIAKQRQLNRLTARERMKKLFDPGTFEETGLLMQSLAPDREGKITHKLRWGGNWNGDGLIVEGQSLVDLPHFELIP